MSIVIKMHQAAVIWVCALVILDVALGAMVEIPLKQVKIGGKDYLTHKHKPLAIKSISRMGVTSQLSVVHRDVGPWNAPTIPKIYIRYRLL